MKLRNQLGQGSPVVTGKMHVNVRDFIQKNYTPYEGDDSFLAGRNRGNNRTCGTAVMEGIKVENKTHAPLDFDAAYSINNHFSRRRAISTKIWKKLLVYRLMLR